MFLVWPPEERILIRKTTACGATTTGDREVFVSPLGNDAEDGLSPATAVRTVTEGLTRLRDGHNDWLRLMPGLHPQLPEMLMENA
jgi:hypothetical protein